MTDCEFQPLGLAEPLRRALADAGYATPTPIQRSAIPLLLEGRDLLGIAQTGTGKTAAFVLPVLQRLADTKERATPVAPRALILAPTRELAVQIGESVRTYGRHLRLRHTVIFGGVGQVPQVRALAAGIDILVATPGRLLDLIGQRHLRLDRAGVLVLDEADRMLDMGFVRDVRRIIALLPKARQSMLFSATMPAEIAGLAADILDRPERVEVAPAGTAIELVDQWVYHVAAADKRTLLGRLLQDAALSRVIVFTRTKHCANRVADHLEKAGVNAAAIHGNKSQSARQNALETFRSGRTRVLVATDIAARGIDVDAVSHIVNFELPNVPETYVHRIGRTARAGASGVAFSLCDPSERPFLRDIEKLIRRAIPVAAGSEAIASAAAGPAERPAGRPASSKSAPPRTGAKPSAPQGARPSAPQGARPSAPQGARPNAPQGAKPSAPQGAKPSAPQGAKPSAPQGAKSGTPRAGKPASAAANDAESGPSPERSGRGRSRRRRYRAAA